MELSEIVKGAFEKAFPGEDFGFVRVVPATDAKFGDYQCNDALKFAKKLKMNPREVGTKIADLLKGESVFEKVEVAGPGFLNLTVSTEWLNAQLLNISTSKHLNIPQSGCASRVESWALSQAEETVRFRKPGPAISTFSNVSPPFRASATFVPTSRGFILNFLASFSASLHW